MPKASEVFSQSEGDRWFERNCLHKPASALQSVYVEYVWERLPYMPRTVLEVGCADGSKLSFLREYSESKKSICGFWGIAPSSKAIAEGRKRDPALHLQQGTADQLPFDNASFGMVILGFCLFLCDRQDLFKIAYEVDRVLTEGGFLVLYDFEARFPFKNTYKHAPGLWSYKMDNRSMFLWNPLYSLMEMHSFSHSGTTFHPNPDERVSVSILHKKHLDAHDVSNPFVS